ncbi:hypothetical protein HDU96_009614 [Phlyctochytrium bullatum]|nr:hypothetical protein HDU96_009614 [Phlyctochytrium bullatum]
MVNSTDPGAPTAAGLDLNSNGFMTSMAVFVFIMVPGLGFFYSGMTRAKNALSMILLSMMAMCVVTVQWFMFGFSLAFSEHAVDGKGSTFIGNFDYAFLRGVGWTSLTKTGPTISNVVFAFYQLQFATITAALIFGSVAERIRLRSAVIFTFFWTTFVYDFAAYWTWGWRGWIKNMACVSDASSLLITDSFGTILSGPCGNGGLDFAGGGPVHIASGFAGLAFSLVLGQRRRVGNEEFKPHNLVNVFLGTALLWFGWYGFNGGSANAGTARAAMAALVTQLATVCGAISWPTLDWFVSGKFSGLGFCSGAVAALVAITPCSGYVAPWAAVVVGTIAGVVCNLGCRIKGYLGYDDSLDVFGIHGVGGFIGNLLCGIFAQKSIASLDNSVILGGWIDGNYKQLGYQLAGSAAIAAYSFVLTYVFLTLLNAIPGLSLRMDPAEEVLGSDLAEMGEVAYELISTVATDFVGVSSSASQAKSVDEYGSHPNTIVAA